VDFADGRLEVRYKGRNMEPDGPQPVAYGTFPLPRRKLSRIPKRSADMITYSTEPGSPVVEIKVAGHVTNDELESAMSRLRVDVEQNGKRRILEIIEHFTGIEPAAIWTDLSLGVPLARKVDRVAVVADQGWVRAFTNIGGMFTQAEVRSFEPAELDQVRAWIGSA
jgi:hypothetical protein